jgi:fucose 4-O-acetylase-like acetyltransferase
MTQRDTDIDLMRGWSMIIVIALHILPYYPAFPGAGFIQWSQMVVPLLLYCSIRVSKPPESLDLRHYMYGVYKRTRRLIVPYFVFLCIYALVHYALMYFYPSVRTLSLAWWVANITLTGGIDFNWLVLLFIGLSVWIPLVQHLSLRNPRWSHIITSVLLLFSTAAFFLQDLLHPFYRFWMVPLWLVFVPLFFSANSDTTYCMGTVQKLLDMERSLCMYIPLCLVCKILTPYA